MKIKYVDKKACDLKRGDKVETWMGEATVHDVINTRETKPNGYAHTTQVLLAGGEKWFVSSDRVFQVQHTKPAAMPKYYTADLWFFIFTSIGLTSMIWMAYLYKWYGIIPNFSGCSG
jgi:hypothetical protein